MRRLLLPLPLFVGQPAWAAGDPQTPAAEPAKPPKELAKELASGDGKSRETAFVIHAGDEGRGVAKEYAILAYLGLKPGSQSLIMENGKTYDTIEATDPKTGTSRTVWFDISKFFGKMF